MAEPQHHKPNKCILPQQVMPLAGGKQKKIRFEEKKSCDHLMRLIASDSIILSTLIFSFSPSGGKESAAYAAFILAICVI